MKILDIKDQDLVSMAIGYEKIRNFLMNKLVQKKVNIDSLNRMLCSKSHFPQSEFSKRENYLPFNEEDLDKISGYQDFRKDCELFISWISSDKIKIEHAVCALFTEYNLRDELTLMCFFAHLIK